jgi:hypothetical protein
VHDDLGTRGFETFLPQAIAWVQQGARRRRRLAPLFPGYLFVRHALDPESHAEVLRARGVVRLLGEGADPIPIGTRIGVPRNRSGATSRNIACGSRRSAVIGGLVSPRQEWAKPGRDDDVTRSVIRRAPRRAGSERRCVVRGLDPEPV